MRKHELPLLREDVMRIVLPASICLILVVVVAEDKSLKIQVPEQAGVDLATETSP